MSWLTPKDPEKQRTKDIQITRVGIGRRPTQDVYHRLLLMSWTGVFLLTAVGYVALNTLFAFAFLAVPGAIEGARPWHFGDAFAFSVQTFSTLGYGMLSPAGTYANTIVTLEAIVGLMYQALITGVAFAKFARPTARILFTDKVCLGDWNGKPALMVRMANERANQVVEARLSLTLVRDEPTEEGQSFRRLRELPLVRGYTPIFSVSWTAVHIIDEDSPLYGLDIEALTESETLLLATFVGTDDTFNQMVHARTMWDTDDFVWNHRFADILTSDKRGTRILDFRNFHGVVPLAKAENAPTKS